MLFTKERKVVDQKKSGLWCGGIYGRVDIDIVFSSKYFGP